MVNEHRVSHNELRAGTSSALQVQARETRVPRSVERRWEEMSLANSSISKTRDTVEARGQGPSMIPSTVVIYKPPSDSLVVSENLSVSRGVLEFQKMEKENMTSRSHNPVREKSAKIPKELWQKS